MCLNPPHSAVTRTAQHSTAQHSTAQHSTAQPVHTQTSQTRTEALAEPKPVPARAAVLTRPAELPRSLTRAALCCTPRATLPRRRSAGVARRLAAAIQVHAAGPLVRTARDGTGPNVPDRFHCRVRSPRKPNHSVKSSQSTCADVPHTLPCAVRSAKTESERVCIVVRDRSDWSTAPKLERAFYPGASEGTRLQ